MIFSYFYPCPVLSAPGQRSHSQISWGSCSTRSWAGQEEQENKTQRREGDIARHSINIRERHETEEKDQRTWAGIFFFSFCF